MCVFKGERESLERVYVGFFFSEEDTFPILLEKMTLISYWENIAFSIHMAAVGLSLHFGSRGGMCPRPDSLVCFTLFYCDWLKKRHLTHVTPTKSPLGLLLGLSVKSCYLCSWSCMKGTA